jgi:hypothetical protein
MPRGIVSVSKVCWAYCVDTAIPLKTTGLRWLGRLVVCIFREKKRFPPHSVKEGGTAGLDGLDLSRVDWETSEAGGQVAAVEEDSLGGLNCAELSTGYAADADLLDGVLEGTELLSMVAVGAEGSVLGARRGPAVAEALGELARRRGGVGLGGAVDVG